MTVKEIKNSFTKITGLHSRYKKRIMFYGNATAYYRTKKDIILSILALADPYQVPSNWVKFFDEKKKT